MKPLINFAIIFLSLLLINNCKKESPIETDPNLPKPQPQVGEFDLIGLEGKSIINFSVNPIEPWHIIVATSDYEVYVTNDYGKIWTQVLSKMYIIGRINWNPNIRNEAFFSPHPRMSESYRAKYGRGMIYFFKSTNYGSDWFPADSGLDVITTNFVKVFKLSPKEGNLIGGTSILAPYYTGDIIQSTDGGIFWQDITDRLFSASSTASSIVLDISINPSTIIYSNTEGGIFKSKDAGKSWKFYYPNYFFTRHILSQNSNLGFGLIRNGVQFPASTENYFETFTKLENDDLNRSSFNDILMNPEDHLFVTAAYKGSDSSYVYLSKDKGSTWSKLGSDTDKKTLLGYDSKNNFLYVVMDGVKKGLYRYKLK
jgi:hypothetical protein